MRILFILYVVFLIVCVGFAFRGSIGQALDIRRYMQQNRADGFPNVRLVPFETIFLDLKNFYSSSHRFAFFGSLLCYVPAGILIPVLLTPYQYNRLREIAKTVFFSFILIVSVEIIQYFSLFGVFNIDDIILGAAGALCGYVIYLIGNRIGTRFFHTSHERST